MVADCGLAKPVAPKPEGEGGSPGLLSVNCEREEDVAGQAAHARVA